ncbi:MAG: hypothetical protein HYV63_07000 [Candidatus Schekmanbacteria bacterium]|nr:hypothetical protein [Candidatus Schekmanbacteria bacterium]
MSSSCATAPWGPLPRGELVEHTWSASCIAGAAIEVAFDSAAAPSAPELPRLVMAAIDGHASGEEHRELIALWQSRVKQILTPDPARLTRVRQLDPQAV